MGRGETVFRTSLVVLAIPPSLSPFIRPSFFGKVQVRVGVIGTARRVRCGFGFRVKQENSLEIRYSFTKIVFSFSKGLTFFSRAFSSILLLGLNAWSNVVKGEDKIRGVYGNIHRPQTKIQVAEN